MAGLHVRKADEKDLVNLLELYREFEEEDNSFSMNLESARDKLIRIQSYPDYSVYVAEKDGEIVGTFELLVMDNLAHYGKPSAIVEDVIVKKELRGAGIGGEMMRFAMETSRQHGCYKLILSSNLMREKAHQFYEALGFEKHGYSFRIDFDGRSTQ